MIRDIAASAPAAGRSPAVTDLPYARIGVRCLPAGHATVGGDWYEAIQLPDGRVFLAVGDVSGHGPPAIAEMTRVQRALLGLTATSASPDVLLARLNALILDHPAETTATVVCGHLDPTGMVFTWAQAGHPPPILVQDGQARPLPPPQGVVLGVLPGPRYGRAAVRLAPGDLLLMFTDGLVERRGRDIDEGIALVAAYAGAVTRHGDLETGLDRLVEEVGGPNPQDDLCVLAVVVA